MSQLLIILILMNFACSGKSSNKNLKVPLDTGRVEVQKDLKNKFLYGPYFGGYQVETDSANGAVNDSVQEMPNQYSISATIGDSLHKLLFYPLNTCNCSFSQDTFLLEFSEATGWRKEKLHIKVFNGYFEGQFVSKKDTMTAIPISLVTNKPIDFALRGQTIIGNIQIAVEDKQSHIKTIIEGPFTCTVKK